LQISVETSESYTLQCLAQMLLLFSAFSDGPELSRKYEDKLKERILLITSNDDTYRKPLLETQGYEVRSIDPQEAEDAVQYEHFDVVLFTSDGDLHKLFQFCAKLKKARPRAKLGVVAQRSEYVPGNECIDAVFRNQHSPGKFLAALRKLIDSGPGERVIWAEGDD
jgi:PleD family two-component response regulator